MIKRFVDNVVLVKELVAVALFISLTLLYYLFKDFSFSLTNFSSIQISQATLDGVDIRARVSLFYKVAASFSILFPTIYLLVNWGISKLKFRINDLQLLAVFAANGIALVFADLYGIQADKMIQVNILIVVFLSLVYSLRKSLTTFRILGNHLMTGSLLTLSIIFLGAVQFLANSSERIVTNGILFYFLILVSITIIHFLLIKNTKIALRKFFVALLPLSLIPIFFFVSVELLFFVKESKGHFIPYKWIFISLTLASFILFNIYNRFKKINISSTKSLTYFYVPSALLTYLLFTYYHPIINQPNDLFELANPTIAQMRMFSFGEIPFVDFLTSHMFAEQFYGIIYNTLFGYSGFLDFMVYEFFSIIIFIFIVYYFALKLWKSAFLALIFILSFPLLANLFHIYLFFSILLFFVVKRVVRNQSIKNFLGLFLFSVLLCFWRLDTGFAALLATSVYLPIHYFTERKKINLLNLIKSTGIFSGVTAAVLLILIALKSKDYIFTSISSALHYFSGSQAHGLSSITIEYNHQFFIYHTLFPLASIFIIGYIIYTLRNSNSTESRFILNSSLFLFLVYLFNFQRALVRHGFIESVDFFIMSTFYLALTLFLLSFIIIKKSIYWKYIYFVSISFLVIITVKYFPLDKEELKLNSFFSQPTISYLDHKFSESVYQGRVAGSEKFAKSTYLDLKEFLDQNLTENQTFLDYSNTPMLYFYCKRSLPSYFCQNLQNTVDDYLQIEQLKRINTTKTPVVIFSNYPQNWWDKTDDVPNIMRQNIIAEHIYSNYKPYRVIDGHSIWIAKGANYKTSIVEVDTFINKPQNFHYKHSAVLLNKYFQKPGRLQEIEKLIPVLSNEKGCYHINVNKESGSSSLVMVKIELEYSAVPGQLSLELFSDSTFVGTTSFYTHKNELEYLIPISNHYLWHKMVVNSIYIDSQEGYKIKSLTFNKDIRDEY